MADFIQQFTAKNYGCLRDVTVGLTPLHAFIGPNDSGKSTLLHGLRTLVQFAGGHFEYDAKKGSWRPFDPLMPQPFEETPEIFLGCSVEGGGYSVCAGAGSGQVIESLSTEEPGASSGEPSKTQTRATTSNSRLKRAANAHVMKQLRSVRLVRFDPDALRSPRGLIPETSDVDFLDERGAGLAGVYFAIRNRDDDDYAAINQGVRKHFPTIKSVRVKAVSSSEVALEAELVSGAKVEAKRMSEGLLYYLAFAALQHLAPVTLLLVEEPENGLHPARIAEVMGVLREISRTTQVILATHSPLVINEMQPDEVSIVTRDPETGTKVTPMRQTANFEKRSSLYALGELWLSFADGVHEAPLLDGRQAS